MKTLDWVTIRSIGSSDNANRWYPNSEVSEYFTHLRSPSRAFPHSYARSAQTVKFAKWLIVNKPVIAQKLGIIGG